MRLRTGPGWRHAEAVVPLIAALARQDAAHPWIVRWTRQAVRRVPRDDAEAEARAIGRAALRSVRYVRDPRGHEFITAPHRTLAHGAADCDEIAGLIASAALAINRTPRFIVIARHDQPHEPVHIWTQIRTPKGWIDVDPVPRPPRIGIGEGVDGIARAWDIHGQETPIMAYVDPYSDLAYIDGFDGFWAKLWSGVKKVAKVAGGVIAKIAPAAGSLIPGLGPAASAAGAISELVSGGGTSTRRQTRDSGPTIIETSQILRPGGPGAGRVSAPAPAAPPRSTAPPAPGAVMVRPPTRALPPALARGAAPAPGAVMVRPAPARRAAAPAPSAAPPSPGARPAPQAVQLFAAALEQQRSAAAMRAAQQAAAAFRAAGIGAAVWPDPFRYSASAGAGRHGQGGGGSGYGIGAAVWPDPFRYSTGAGAGRHGQGGGGGGYGIGLSPQTEAAVTAGDLRTLAAQAVYGVRRGLAAGAQRARIERFQRAAGLTVTGTWDAATRRAAAAALGRPESMMPPAVGGRRRASEPPAAPEAPAAPSAPEAPVQVAPPGSVPPAPPAAPAGIPPSVAAGTTPSTPSASSTPVQIAPPGTVTTTTTGRGMDTATVALLVILGVAIARRRR
jgi:hypothetical protein